MERKHFIVFITAIFCLISCQQKSGLKIALMFPYTTSARMAIEEKFFKAKAAELNCEAIITDANNDYILQSKQAQELIDQKVDVIVIMAVNTNIAAEIVRDAHNAGVKVIAYDRLINNCDLDYYLSHNNYNVGKFMGDYALKYKPEGKYILIGGDKTDRNAIYVKNGQLDAIRSNVQSGKIKVMLDVFIEDWSGENAYRTMKEYINLSANDVPDVILTSYDGLAYGVRQALDEARITADIIVSGQDAEPQAIKNIVSGKQTMTIYKPLKELAESAVTIAIKLARGEKVDTTTTIYNLRKNVPAYLINPIAVDKSNIMETVVKDGQVKASDVGL